MGKLTERQLAMLRHLLIGGKYHSGVTGISLVKRGLATTNQHGCTIITDAGRAALQEGREGMSKKWSNDGVLDHVAHRTMP